MGGGRGRRDGVERVYLLIVPSAFPKEAGRGKGRYRGRRVKGKSCFFVVSGPSFLEADRRGRHGGQEGDV